MRLNCILRKARSPQGEPVPFAAILPLQLKNRVSGKGGKSKEVACLHEMQLLFACFKNHEFNQQLCSKEISSFQECYSKYRDDRDLKKSHEQKGVLLPGEKNFSGKQLNKYLRKFPSN